jgi:hypothetical protein
MAYLPRAAHRAERLIYKISGLPIAVQAWFSVSDGDPASVIREAFAWRYWHPDSFSEWTDLVASLILWPAVLVLATLWFTARNGPTIRRREHKSLHSQAGEQFRQYFANGILAPWYYIFSLHRDGARRAPSFLQRCETTRNLYPLLRSKNPSPLNDKKKFVDRCVEHKVHCVHCLLYLDGTADSEPGASLPNCDLFVKPATGRGGKGAQRWDRTARGTYSTDGVHEFSQPDLVRRLNIMARQKPLIVQPRIMPHPALADLTSGALPTIRMMTCLNEEMEPEVVAASFRMSIGGNRTVDNFHAGGIACSIELETGELGLASNLGMDAGLGWLVRHPTTHARIEGRRLPLWGEAKALAIEAHRSFSDRVVIGWDIAVAVDGPIVVEGNSSPDVDLIQRFMDVGLCQHRLGELFGYHLRVRGYAH